MEAQECSRVYGELVQRVSVKSGLASIGPGADLLIPRRIESSRDLSPMSLPQCRFCKAVLEHTFVDLGMFPFSNSYLRQEQISSMEPFFPLHARVCVNCFLVQLEQFEAPQGIFSEYAYFSSYSETSLNHAREYAGRAVSRFQLNRESLVVEIASNDGYLLQYFQAWGVPVLGVEPAQNVASVAEEKGIKTIAKFFGIKT